MTKQQDALRELLHQIDLDQTMRERAVQQAITEAHAWHWRNRADTFQAAAPRPGDWIGNATQNTLDTARERCHQTAQACRNRAQLIEMEAATM